MNKQTRLLGIAVVGMIALLLPLNAEAACGADISFGGYYSQATNTAGSTTLRSSFWIVGSGNPAPAAGNDNGLAQENNGVNAPWVVPYHNGFGVLSGWAQVAEYDGCADAAGDPSIQRMAVVLSDIVGGVPMFRAMCTDRDTQAGVQFSFDFPPGCTSEATCVEYDLVPIPKPVVTGTTRAGTQATITIGSPNFAPGFLSDGSVGCELNAVIPQYDVYKQEVGRNVAPNSTRDAGPSWALVGTGNTGSPFTLPPTTCAGDCDVYIAVSPHYANGFTTGEPASAQAARVGLDSTKVQAGPILANPPKSRITNPKKAQ